MTKTPTNNKTKKPETTQLPPPSLDEPDRMVHGITSSILRLEETQDFLMDQFRKARTLENKMKLSNALASNCRALFQGYRAMTLLQGGMTPMEKAYNDLKVLEFDED